jgi:rubrerythrin
MKGPKAFADYIKCLSILENNTAQLYHVLSNQTEIPLAKTLLLNIALDSTKHSTILRGISNSLATSKKDPKDCAKNLGDVWRTVDYLKSEVTRTQNGSKLELSKLAEKLSALESSLGEEYHVFVQMENLEYLSKEINQFYNVNLDSIRKIINSIIRDEEHHRELLSTIKQLLDQSRKENLDNTPMMKFQSPDSWIQATNIDNHEEP